MTFVFGGAYQGKHDFAKEELSAKDTDIIVVSDVSEENIEGIIQSSDKHTVIIMNDISQGVVPMDAKMRAYREASGKAMIRLAKEADEVYRVFCGIGIKIK
ncbi:MAG: bifunctional adenosylcobinamide kinase/adenosylcobinamide-phosphate guanylyltransferase [Firmicutes bacterium]|nr:bifunctional adenosylcobinamide kinase/adenosylcobinamide-phosphate guanylyltransferase [Bacillota bacterium]